MMGKKDLELKLPVIDLFSSDPVATANSIHQGCWKKVDLSDCFGFGPRRRLLCKRWPPGPFLRLLHYPGALGFLDEKVFGASAHSDYGMMTLVVSDGVLGLQVCREKSKQPQVWEDVHHISGAFVVNIGDLMERWTNCLYRSTLHRVILTGQERYSMAFFLNPFPDSVVECLKSCCTV